jgi:putative NADH-flavin reductase
VITAIGPRHDGTDHLDLLGSVAHGLIDGLRKAGVRRLIVVGGAGSLRDGDILHMDSPRFNAAWHPLAMAHMAARDVYFTADDLDWTYVSPPTDIGPGGERTGAYRTGGDELLSAPDGTSAIADPDFAIAVADELERPASVHRQITFAY